MKESITNRPLGLDGARNVRELGGYPAGAKMRTRQRVFLRSDGTHALTDKDLSALRELGVTLVVDLRSPEELRRQPSRLNGVEGIRYVHVSMFDGAQSSFFRDVLPPTMSELYINLLDHCTEQYRTIFGLFAENEGTSLFNCSAGKDRTGVVAMLLLRLAGVADDVILDDYAASEANLSGLRFVQQAQLEKMGIDVPAHVFESRPEEMEKALAHLDARYGGAEAYLLKACGLEPDQMETIRRRFVENV